METLIGEAQIGAGFVVAALVLLLRNTSRLRSQLDLLRHELDQTKARTALLEEHMARHMLQNHEED